MSFLKLNLNSILFELQPMHDDYDLRQEQMNKYSLLSSQKFLKTLLEMFNDHVVSKSKRIFLGETF